MNFNSKHGCQKCTIVGKYSHISHTVVFTKIELPLRTDELFRAKQYPGHQKVETPLTKLPINLIKDVVVADPLHLLELGVMKRLINGWRTGDLGYTTKWSKNDKMEISEFLLKIQMPSEIHRDILTLKEIANWKGLEFRNFLNYYGVAVLVNFLPNKHYEHFLQLFCAVTICSSEKYLCHLNVAKILFKQFIIDYKTLYGSEFITSNVHNLEHVVDDVARFGVLSSISAYPFENCLYTIKKMLRAGKHPLVQIVNRLTERLFIPDFNFKNHQQSSQPVIRNMKDGNCEIDLSDYKLSNFKFKDMWFKADQKIMCMENAFEKDSNIFIQGRVVDICNDLFVTPLKSSLLNMYRVNIQNIKQGELQCVNICDIKSKFVAIQYLNNDWAFIPLLHTIK